MDSRGQPLGFRRCAHSAESAHELPYFVFAQWLERDHFACGRTAQRAHPSCGGAVALDGARGEGDEPENRSSLQFPYEKMEQRAAVGVAPLHVVDEHRQRRLLRDREEHLRDSLEEAPAVRRRRGDDLGEPAKRCLSSGTTRATSASHCGSVPLKPGASIADRSASIIAPNGTPTRTSKPRPRSTVPPSAVTQRAKSSARRDLPTPDSPSMSTARDRLRETACHVARSRSHSLSRPMRLP